MKAVRASYRLSRRWNHSSTMKFVSNEQRYLFEGEKLTPEQNDAAIPLKPSTDHIRKIYHDITNPEEVCDLVLNLKPKDTLTSVLSINTPILGGAEYQFIKKDGTESKVKTHFANLTCAWVDIFNNQIKSLSDLKDSEAINFNNSKLDEKINAALENFDFTKLDITELYTSLNAFKSSQLQSEGTLSKADLTNHITIEYLTIFLINSSNFNQNIDNFTQLISFVTGNTHEISHSSIKNIFLNLIDNIYLSSLHTSPRKLKSFTEFVEYLTSESDFKALDLDTTRLDRLAFLLSISKNISLAKACLETLVLKKFTAPSKETFDSFIAHFENTGRSNIIQELANFKSVFFHSPITRSRFNILIQTVESMTDLEHLIGLIELKDVNNNLITKYQYDLFVKLQSIQQLSSSSKVEKLLQISQLISRLVISKQVKLNHQTIELLGDAYSDARSNSNMEVLRHLHELS